jgi:thioesterase domain-containing protein/acyl carrier protein
VFASVLGVDRVGLDDDFFELGGDSLGVVELLAAINEEFGVDLPASAVLDAPTVAELSTRLAHRRSRHASPLVELRNGQPGDPFFCVTGAGAPAISLRALATAVDGHNFVAIQHRGLEERARPDRTIHSAALRNVLALREQQPVGPYRLGGFSYGAVVAFEMACLLERAGEHVDLLVVLDAPAPGSHPPDLGTRGAARLQAIRTDAPTGGARRPLVVGTRAARAGARWVYASARHRVVVGTAGLVPRHGLDQYNLFVAINASMAHRYTPIHTYDGPLLLVRSTVGGPTRFGDAEQDLPHRALWDFGWSTHVTGPVTVVDVPGDHLGLLRNPAVEQTGQHVARALG